jgi:hypothetical protein
MTVTDLSDYLEGPKQAADPEIDRFFESGGGEVMFRLSGGQSFENMIGNDKFDIVHNILNHPEIDDSDLGYLQSCSRNPVEVSIENREVVAVPLGIESYQAGFRTRDEFEDFLGCVPVEAYEAARPFSQEDY